MSLARVPWYFRRVRSGLSLAAVVLVAGLGGVGIGCRAPTQITVEVRTDVPCADLSRTKIRIGTLDSGNAIVDTTFCTAGRVGSLVVVPSGSRDAEVAIAVVMELKDTAPHDCRLDGPSDLHCIVARRALTFVEHTELDLPVDLRLDCRGVVCDTTHTCVHGNCVDARISDAKVCHGNGCDDANLGGGSDAGAEVSNDVGDAGDTRLDASDAGDASDVRDVRDVSDASDGDAGHLDVLRIGVGELFACALLSDRTVWCWGDNVKGQLGDGTVGPGRSTPAPVLLGLGGAKLDSITDLVVGQRHACAKKLDDTVVCWGDGAAGQLGDGLLVSHSSPVTVLVTAGGAPLKGATSLVAGDRRSCALTGAASSATVLCWGDNGDVSPSPHAPPGPSLTGVTLVAHGSNHVCVRKIDATALCWGYNFDGELGDGTNTDQTEPTPVLVSKGGTALTPVATLTGGYFSTCARMSDGTARCWGSNSNGQLGDGSETGLPSYSPVTVVATAAGGAALTGIQSIASGDAHACGLMSDATLHCWGRNGDGEIGDGTSDDTRSIQTQVLVSLGGAPLANVLEVATGDATTCARTADGLAYCWGRNGVGQTGDGTTTTPRPSPRRVLLP